MGRKSCGRTVACAASSANCISAFISGVSDGVAVSVAVGVSVIVRLGVTVSVAVRLGVAVTVQVGGRVGGESGSAGAGVSVGATVPDDCGATNRVGRSPASSPPPLSHAANPLTSTTKNNILLNIGNLSIAILYPHIAGCAQ